MATLKEKNAIKENFCKTIQAMFAEDDAKYTKDNVLMVPFVYPSGEEGFVTITVSIPTGTRNGEAYDGYEAAADYEFDKKDKAEKAKAKAEAKAKKIERDKKLRESAAAKKAARG